MLVDQNDHDGRAPFRLVLEAKVTTLTTDYVKTIVVVVVIARDGGEFVPPATTMATENTTGLWRQLGSKFQHACGC